MRRRAPSRRLRPRSGAAPRGRRDGAPIQPSGVSTLTRRARARCVSTIASAFGSIHSTLHSSKLALAANVLILLAIVLWLGLGFRVYRDARRRVDDGFLVA